MISLAETNVRLCERMTRREWLRVGGLPVAGLTLPALLAGQARAEKAADRGRPGRAKSCIVLFLFGAPAHQDIWDLKPDARAEVRGEFQPIATSQPGIFVGEHIPKIAGQAHRLALVRSVTHPDNVHTVAMHYMLTGVRHLRPQSNPQNEPSDFPTFGAVVQYPTVTTALPRLRAAGSALPAAVSLNAPANQVSANNHIFPGFFGGILGRAHDPLFVADDPSAAGFKPFPAAAGEALRLEGRQALRAVFEGQIRTFEGAAAARNFDTFQKKALALVSSVEARRAFDVGGESPRLRDRYGPTAFGQGCLLARRLVEAGVRLVTVNWARDDAFWDTHSDNFNRLKRDLLPPFDRGLAALLDDLAERGLLDETLVVVLSEFGRTPQINKPAGRDHWAACNTVVFAGGGVRGGQVVGASDRNAAYPVDRPTDPADVAATIYHALGVPLETELRDALGRPFPVCTGRPIHELG